jgi:hypothetical protein
MEQYYFRYIEKCHKCQENSNLIHIPTVKLHEQVPIFPFSVWILDIIGKILLPSFARHTLIITTMDYFMKWVEDVPLHLMNIEVIC